MGWTTLTLRKQTLKVEHNNYELQLLQISSARRSLARSKQVKIASLNTDKSEELGMLQKASATEYKEALVSGNQTDIQVASLNYQEAKEKYAEEKQAIEEMYETEKEELEAETTAQENELDEQQTEIESIIESISQELQSVSQQISSDIQTSTIQLK